MRTLPFVCLHIGMMLGFASLVSAQSLNNNAPGGQPEQGISTGKTEQLVTAVNCRTQFAVSGNKKIAYRAIGKGKPVILCNRLRGVLDSWDPAFLDELGKTFQVFIFDYSGIGSSAGELPLKIADVAEDVNFLASYLKLDKFVLGGWSYGGLVAQTFATHYPERISHLVLLGTNPPGTNKYPLEQVFLDATMKVNNDLNDEMILFFEPNSAFSRHAARQSNERIAARTIDRDPPVPEAVWSRYLAGAKDYADDAYGSREKLARIHVPVLVISGDHDPACPIENWYALSRKIPNLQLIMLGQTGHGPQHQYPALTVQYINNFIKLAQL